jgi:pimeloyl-ACP methyl ester carboxylesterase
VLVVHGLACPKLFMTPLAVRLRRAGFEVINWGYPSLLPPIERNARRLGRRLAELERRGDVDSIRLVTHSMGGMLARQACAEFELGKLHRVVMLGPPNQGSRAADSWARWLGAAVPPLQQLSARDRSYVRRLHVPQRVQIGIIAGSKDRVVGVPSTHLSGETDHCVVPTGHMRMLIRRDVAELVERFLREGRFRRCADAPSASGME